MFLPAVRVLIFPHSLQHLLLSVFLKNYSHPTGCVVVKPPLNYFESILMMDSAQMDSV